MERLKLLHSILINGKEYKELKYDTESLTAENFIEASTKAGAITNKVMELNTKLHEKLGMCAIIATDRDIDYADLERAKGRDIISIVKIGRDMFVGEKEISINKEKNTINLKHGLNGKKELKYDLESISIEQFDIAYDKSGYASNKVMELNEAFHLWLGAYSVANAEEMKIEDVMSAAKGKDVLALATLGRTFFTPIAEDIESQEHISQQGSSEEQ